MGIEQLLESIGVENSKEVAKQLEEHINGRIQNIEDEYEVKLAEAATRLQEEAEKVAKEELEEHKENLLLWHKAILNQELTECNNQLKIAAEIRTIRNGMEKILEGMKEIGIDTTQMFENVAASEVVSLQDEIEILKESINQKEHQLTAFQRAFIVSESTRNMTDVERDKIVASADAIDESIEPERFKKLIENIISVNKATGTETLKETINENKSAGSEFNDDYNLKFQSLPKQPRDISAYFI